MIVLEQVGENIQATADFHQQNLAGARASKLKGELLRNGNFIFSWEDGAYRKMVLTRNNGDYLENGYMTRGSVSGSNWKNPANWSARSFNTYSISNFVGKRRGIPYVFMI